MSLLLALSLSALVQAPAAIQPVEPWAAIARLEVAENGAMLGCSNDNHGPVQDADQASVCNFPPPPRILLAMRGGGGRESVTVVIETHFNVSGMNGFPRVYQQPGRRLTALIESRFEITQDGRVENCEIVDRQGSALASLRICDHMFTGPYAVDSDGTAEGQRRTAGVVIATSVEAAAEEPQSPDEHND